MSDSNAAYLEALKTARDAIVAGIAAGRLTVTYKIRNREHTTSDPVLALKRIDESIDIIEKKVSRATTSPYRLASMSPARGT